METTVKADADSAIDLSVSLGRLKLRNPIMVASGTFGYAREMQGLVQLDRLGAIIPKTITLNPRPGNAPWRTVETAAGLLNSIGLDNDGIDYFVETHLPYLRQLGTAVVVSVAGKSVEEFFQLASRIGQAGGATALELNISCPNVSGGVDFGIDPHLCEQVVRGVRENCDLPVLAKLTPNVSRITDIAKAAEAGGADAVCCVNTLLGMAVDWRKKRPILGNIVGGLSGPAVKPVALRCVYQVARAVQIPVVGIGGIGTIDDVMEFMAAGASAVQVGTANYYDPTISQRLIEQLPSALIELGVTHASQAVKTF